MRGWDSKQLIPQSSSQLLSIQVVILTPSCAHPPVRSWILYSACCEIAVLTSRMRKLKKAFKHENGTRRVMLCAKLRLRVRETIKIQANQGAGFGLLRTHGTKTRMSTVHNLVNPGAHSSEWDQIQANRMVKCAMQLFIFIVIVLSTTVLLLSLVTYVRRDEQIGEDRMSLERTCEQITYQEATMFTDCIDWTLEFFLSSNLGEGLH